MARGPGPRPRELLARSSALIQTLDETWAARPAGIEARAASPRPLDYADRLRRQVGRHRGRAGPERRGPAALPARSCSFLNDFIAAASRLSLNSGPGGKYCTSSVCQYGLGSVWPPMSDWQPMAPTAAARLKAPCQARPGRLTVI